MLAASGRVCGSGEIGRHTILRGWRRKAWGFKSPLPHQSMLRSRLGSILGSADPLPEAKALTRQIIEIRKRVSGPEYSDNSSQKNNQHGIRAESILRLDRWERRMSNYVWEREHPPFPRIKNPKYFLI